MDRDTARAAIVAKIAEQFSLDPAEIQDEDNLAKKFGAKSHDIVQLNVKVQVALGIKIGYAQARKLLTVGDWVDFATK